MIRQSKIKNAVDSTAHFGAGGPGNSVNIGDRQQGVNRKRKRTERIGRILLPVYLLLAVFLPAFSEAQQGARLPKLGWIAAASSTPALNDTFRQGLQQLGYVEGQNILIEQRQAQTVDQLASLAAELVRLEVNVIFASGGGLPVLAAKKATATIPIAMSKC